MEMKKFKLFDIRYKILFKFGGAVLKMHWPLQTLFALYNTNAGTAVKAAVYIKTQKFRRKNSGGNIFGPFLQNLAENFSDRFYNGGKNFGLKKCDSLGKRAVFKGQFIETLNQMT